MLYINSVICACVAAAGPAACAPLPVFSLCCRPPCSCSCFGARAPLAFTFTSGSSTASGPGSAPSGPARATGASCRLWASPSRSFSFFIAARAPSSLSSSRPAASSSSASVHLPSSSSSRVSVPEKAWFEALASASRRRLVCGAWCPLSLVRARRCAAATSAVARWLCRCGMF